MSAPEGILCSKSHEYVICNDKECKIGLTDFAVEQLGDIVFIELPDVDSTYSKGEVFGTVESVKAASELYMPVSGKVTETNERLLDSPEVLNEDSYDIGWLIKIEPEDFQGDSGDLLEYDDYKEEVE